MKDEIIYQNVPQNFIAPEIKGSDFVLGSKQLPRVVLRPDGDWRDYRPQDEQQQRRGIETSACATFHTIKPVAILQEERHGLKDQNYSERFISQLSGTTKYGNSPSTVAQTIRDFGLIADSVLPFSDDIQSWEEYNSFKGQSESYCRSLGKEWLTNWDFGYEWVFTGMLSVQEKYRLMREALKYSPLGVSVYAWAQKPNGEYTRPAGAMDGHWCTLLYIDEQNRAHISDTYAPFTKILEPYFNFGFVMRYHVEKLSTEPVKSFWQRMVEFIKRFTLSPEPIVEPVTLSNREKLHITALSCLNTDASPDDLAPDELGCVETINQVYKKAFGKEIGGGLSTYRLYEALKKHKDFQRVDVPEKGDLILSPTGYSPSKIVPSGHVGIVDVGGIIMSNESSSGLFKRNYTLQSWKDRWGKEKYPILYYRRL